MQERHVDDLVDAYVLGALEPTEVDAVERHLEGCSACTALVTEAKRVTDALLFAAPRATPPPSLKNRLLARIAAEAQENGTQSSTANAPEPGASARASTNPVARFVRSLLGEPVRGDERAERLLHDLLIDPDVQIWPVNGTDDAPHAGGRLIGGAGKRDAVLVLSGLAEPGPGREYQVWFLAGGKPVPNALFNVDRSGRGLRAVRAPGPISAFDTVAVTPEPVGGSPGPTGPIVLAGSLVTTQKR